MRIAIINCDYPSSARTPAALLERFAPLVWQAEGLCEAGADVRVVQRFSEDATLELNGVTYLFLADRFPPHLRSWQSSEALRRLAPELEVQVAHVHGLVFPAQTVALRHGLSPACALVLQQHSELPRRGPHRLLQRLCFSAVNALTFPTVAFADAWRIAEVVRHQPVHIVPEVSRHVVRMNRADARQVTGLDGNPVILWMARLVEDKDPLTVLDGFELALPDLPDAKLHIAHGAQDPLLPAVRARIASSQALTRSVRLLGPVERAELECYYHSADYFVVGSTRYGSIIALLEAMACGVVPLVTDTPWFRGMLGDHVGRLWQPGSAASFCESLIGAVREDHLAEQGVAAQQHFAQALSLPVLSKRWLSVYEQAIAHRMTQHTRT